MTIENKSVHEIPNVPGELDELKGKIDQLNQSKKVSDVLSSFQDVAKKVTMDIQLTGKVDEKRSLARGDITVTAEDKSLCWREEEGDMVSTFFDIGSYGFSSKVKVVYDENDGTLQYSLRDAHANDFLAQTVSAKDDSNIEEIIRKANLCNFVLRKAKDYVEDKGDGYRKERDNIFVLRANRSGLSWRVCLRNTPTTLFDSETFYTHAPKILVNYLNSQWNLLYRRPKINEMKKTVQPEKKK